MMNLKEKTHSRNMKENREKLRTAQEKLRLMEENASNLQGKLRVGIFALNIFHNTPVQGFSTH